jgi:hypothetical protein
VNHACGIIDTFASNHAAGQIADQLYSGWTQFGETPSLATEDPNCGFSGSDYARQRFEEIYGADR